MDTNTQNSNPTRMQLQAKIAEKRLQRASKHAKEHILEKTMKQMGIDKDKFQQDLDAVTKAGKLEVNLKK